MSHRQRDYSLNNTTVVTRSDLVLADCQKQLEKTSSALVQMKEISQTLAMVKDRVEICELANADLQKKLEIVESIRLGPGSCERE